MDSSQTSLGEFESTLKKHAQELVESLERGRFGEAVQLIHELNQTRDRGLYQEVGKLTRELQPQILVDDRLDLMDVPGGWDYRTPEQVARVAESWTGRALARALPGR